MVFKVQEHVTLGYMGGYGNMVNACNLMDHVDRNMWNNFKEWKLCMDKILLGRKRYLTSVINMINEVENRLGIYTMAAILNKRDNCF
jgi:hypothetical protein